MPPSSEILVAVEVEAAYDYVNMFSFFNGVMRKYSNSDYSLLIVSKESSRDPPSFTRQE